jgi:endoglucanase Acf2
VNLKCLCVALGGGVCLVASVFAQVAISVGQGSYASYPPAHEGDGPIEMQQRTIYTVEPNAAPIPTNDWWTHLLVSQYAGTMWAYPLAVSANDRGVNVYFPKTFNASGSTMQTGTPLQIRGKVDPGTGGSSLLLADFESAGYPPGWVTTGTAFGSGPAAGTLPGQSRVSGYLGERLVNSYLPGDQSTGTLTSPAFVVDSPYLHFLLAGGNHPGETEVQLVVGGQVVRASTGDNSESLEWETWDLSGLIGDSAQIVIIDLATGGWGHVCADHFVLSDSPSNPAATFAGDFAPLDARAKAWSDWLVSFQAADADSHVMDVTFGHGLPYVWIECTDLEPRIVSSSGAGYFDAVGTVSDFPITGDALGVEFDGRQFGLYTPAGTIFEAQGDTLAIRFTGMEAYLVVAALPDSESLAQLQTHAYAIPRETRFDWTYETQASTVTTEWTIMAEALRGTATDVLQGWLPHHYRTTEHDMILSGPEYVTPRGLLKCSAGQHFEITRDFPGILPNLPAPRELGTVEHDFDPGRMDLYLTMYSGRTSYGSDTYWGGKDLVRLGRYMTFADELGDTEARDILRQTLRGALEDWYTYTPGELEHYFAAYPKWGALVGFNESYYSYSFTDHHFHYGYHTMAAALLAMFDDTFLVDYGEMASLVAKEYANWDRNDQRFPYLRTFDPWRGHSYAGGLSSPGGNNQESSSEAIQSWAGLFLLGDALGDAEMRAAGAMGYALESEAVMEYWQDYYGQQGQAANFSPAYQYTITGILFDTGQAYSTYFTGDPAWIYGIQWLPISPALSYLARDPNFAALQYVRMMTERDGWLEAGEQNTFSQMGTSLANVVLGYLQLFDPDFVAAEMDALWSAADPVAADNYTGGITYYFTHANRRLGAVDDGLRTNIPASCAFYDAGSDVTRIVLHNPEDRYRLASLFSSEVLQGYIPLPPRQLIESAQWLAPVAGFAALGAYPGDGAIDVPADTNQVAVVFSEAIDPGSLSGMSISGPGVSGITFDSLQDELLAVLSISGQFTAGETYAVTLPASVSNVAGTQTLGSEFGFMFTVAEPPADAGQAALVAHYRLDELSGATADDSSESGLDGDYRGEPALGEIGAVVGTGTSVAFDGASQDISLGSPIDFSVLINDFTVSAWVRPTVTGGNRVIFGSGWQDYNGWSLRLSGSTLALERLGPSQLYSSGVSMTTGAWTHVVATYSSQNDVTFYIDGTQVASVAGDAPASVATQPWHIASNGSGDRFAGWVDEVQVYSSAVDAAAAGFLYDNPGRTLASRIADVNADGVLDVGDLDAAVDCLTGPSVAAQVECTAADLDSDGDVDVTDVAAMQEMFDE